MEHRKTAVLVLILIVILSFNLCALVLRKSPIPSVSAVQAGTNVGVYWDRGCTQVVSSINWGTLTPGGTQNAVVYVRNEGNETTLLDLTALNWQPDNAYQWLNFSWTCRNNTIGAGQVVRVTGTLSVASGIPSGFSGFSFGILFQGGPHLLGDINGDGVVDLHDVAIVAAAYGSHCANYDYPGEPASPNWNPLADLNGDGVVDMLDFQIVVSEYGQTG